MIVLEIIEHAGQGNQMFMYSAAYALARKTNQKMIILFSTDYKRVSDRPFILDKFNLDYNYIKKIIRIDKYKNIFIAKIMRKFYKFKYKKLLKNNFVYYEKEGNARIYNQLPTNYKNYYLRGYFESYKYFNEYKQDIINQFKINFELNDKTANFLKEISENNSVAMHIRRGDFLLEGRSVSTDYYKTAIKKLSNNMAKFYLATIDKKVIDEFKNNDNVELIDTNDVNKDLCDWLALSKCKQHILSNSTYSWWAAYISNSNKIYLPTFEEYKFMQTVASKQEYEDFYFKENNI